MSKYTKVASVLGAVGIAAAMFGSAGTAFAASPSPSLPDPAATGRVLNIHKYTAPRTGALGEKNKPVAGVKYKVTRVEEVGGVALDLTKAEGWKAASTLATAYNAKGANKEAEINKATLDPTGVEKTTDTDGLASFAGLPIGLYLVQEEDTSAAQVGGKSEVVQPSDAFLVTLPTTDAKAAWDYSIDVYPKNDTIHIIKAVNDASAVDLDDAIEYTITADVPKAGDSNALTGFTITDALDSHLVYVGASLTAVHLDGGDTLDASDYTITAPAAESNGTVTATLKSGGIAKLKKATGDDSSDVQVVLTVTARASGSGVIPNRATVAISSDLDNNGTPETVTDESNTVYTKFGGINIKKVAAENTTQLLNDAVFQVYKDTNQDGILNDGDVLVSIHGKDAWKTGTDGAGAGLATIDGLRYSTFADNGSVDGDGDDADGVHKYLLVETVAPAGYELLAQAIPFQVDQQVDAVPPITVEDVQRNAGFTLPEVGGKGAIGLTAGAAILAAMGLTIATKRRRKDATE